jgi:hypothetical protein
LLANYHLPTVDLTVRKQTITTTRTPRFVVAKPKQHEKERSQKTFKIMRTRRKAMHMMVLALVLSLLAASSAAKVPVTVDLASRGLDGVVDLSTFAQLPCIRQVPSRLETSEKIIAIQVDTPNFPSPKFGRLEEYLQELVVSFDNFTMFIKGVGTYVSIPDVSEYNYLASEEVNNGFLKYEKREILKIECSNHTEDDDTVFVTFQEELEYNFGEDRTTRLENQAHVFCSWI